MTITNFHISICGHAKHGKSTLAGRLAYELKGLPNKQLAILEEEASKRGKDFNKFSMLFLKSRSDTFSKETGLPDDSSRTEFPTRGSIIVDSMRLTLIDTPGISRFLDSIIYGIYISDRSIVVVEANAGVDIGTEAVCRILKAFDIPIIAFCVTKLDAVGYSQLRFEEVKNEINSKLIKKYDFNTNIPIIPVSALEGIGIAPEKEQFSTIPWYSGVSLIEQISNIENLNYGEITSDIRIAIQGPREILSPHGVGTVLIGTLEYGMLQVGEQLLAEPVSSINGEDITFKVRSIHIARGINEISSQPVSEVNAKNIVALGTPNWSIKDASKHLRYGGILGPIDNRPKVANCILADLIFFEPDVVYSGKEYKLQPHVTWTGVRFQNIISRDLLNFNLKYEEFSTHPGELIRAKIEFKRPCCIENNTDFPRLSKFVILDMNRVVACGKCMQILN